MSCRAARFGIVRPAPASAAIFTVSCWMASSPSDLAKRDIDLFCDPRSKQSPDPLKNPAVAPERAVFGTVMGLEQIRKSKPLQQCFPEQPIPRATQTIEGNPDMSRG